MHNASAVHQDANGQTQRDLRALDTFFDVFSHGDIGCDTYRVDAVLTLQRSSQGFNTVGAASSAADGSTCSSKRFRYCFANTAGGACYLLQHMTACRGVLRMLQMRIPMHTVLAKGDHSFQRLQDLNLSFLPFRFIAMVMSMVTGVPQSSAVACPAETCCAVNESSKV